jgi:Spy/CpxP family protein refolding chaperone
MGLLAASVGLNVYHARARTALETPCQAPCAQDGQPCCSLMSTLDLTADQKRQFASCCPPFTQRCSQLGQRCDTLLVKLERELGAKNPDDKRIEQLVQQLGDLRTEQLKNRIHSILLVRKTLTPKQLQRLAGAPQGT